MRDYDPTTGRYLQADPLGLVDGASVFGYARGNPGRWVDFIGLTAVCPVVPPRLVAGWIPYAGDPSLFHCGFEGYHEDREPMPVDPIAECFYDKEGCLVNERHPYSLCRGTPNQYADGDWWNHVLNDSGGIYENGMAAYEESRRHDRDKAGHNPERVMNRLRNFNRDFINSYSPK